MRKTGKSRVTAAQMKIQGAICLWILACNLILNLLHLPDHGVHFVNWAFFLINILFFLDGETSVRRRYLSVMVGSLVGIVLAGLVTWTLLHLWSEYGGPWPYLPALMLPLAVAISCMILLHPLFPVVCNNCGFAYFLVSLTIMSNEPWGGDSFSNIPAYLISAVLGHLIVNGVCLLLIQKFSGGLEGEDAAP